MEVQNFTPLDVHMYRLKKKIDIQVVLLFLITITLAVLAILLFLLIQKKIQTMNFESIYLLFA